MNVKLNWRERISLPQVMPGKDTYLAMKLAKDIADKVQLTQEEFAEFGLTQVGTSINIKPEMVDKTDKEIEFTEIEVKLVVKQLKALDDKKELTTQLVSLYEKFIDAK